MSDPQIWTLIGVFAASTFGMCSLIATMFTRTLRAEIGGLRGELTGEIGGLRGELTGEIGGLRGELSGEIGGLRGELSGEIGGLRGELTGLRAEMSARFETVGHKIDALDRDIEAITRRVFPE